MGLTLDKYAGMEIPLYADPDDPRAAFWCRHWESRPGFDRLDSIRVSESEADRLIDPLREMTENSSDLVMNPALKEFELVVRESVLSNAMTVVRFKKTILPKEPVRIPGGDGSFMEIVPCTDAFMSFRNAKEVDSVMTIFAFCVRDGDGRKRLTGTMQKEYWRNYNTSFNAYISENSEDFRDVMRDIKLAYIGIQRAMYNKPVVFAAASRQKVQTSAKVSRKGKSRNKAGIIRTICINQEELDRYAQPHKHMTCPCWGVIGHWRTYKNGRQVWIAPYRKGKERNNPDAYQAKDYEFMEGIKA